MPGDHQQVIAIEKNQPNQTKNKQTKNWKELSGSQTKKEKAGIEEVYATTMFDMRQCGNWS